MPKEKKKKENYSREKASFFEEFVWHTLLGLFLLGIFILSANEGSGEHYWNLWVFFERKGAHVFEFFVLSYLFWKVLSFYALRAQQRIWLTFLFPLLYASWDEVHQLFVFGREGKLLDVGIDLIGILLFIVIFQLQKKFFTKRKIPK